MIDPWMMCRYVGPRKKKIGWKIPSCNWYEISRYPIICWPAARWQKFNFCRIMTWLMLSVNTASAPKRMLCRMLRKQQPPRRGRQYVPVVDSPKQRAVPVPNQQHAPCHRADVVARTTDKPSPNMLGFNWPLAWLKDEVFGGGPPMFGAQHFLAKCTLAKVMQLNS